MNLLTGYQGVAVATAGPNINPKVTHKLVNSMAVIFGYIYLYIYTIFIFKDEPTLDIFRANCRG